METRITCVCRSDDWLQLEGELVAKEQCDKIRALKNEHDTISENKSSGGSLKWKPRRLAYLFQRFLMVIVVSKVCESTPRHCRSRRDTLKFWWSPKMTFPSQRSAAANRWAVTCDWRTIQPIKPKDAPFFPLRFLIRAELEKISFF